MSQSHPPLRFTVTSGCRLWGFADSLGAAVTLAQELTAQTDALDLTIWYGARFLAFVSRNELFVHDDALDLIAPVAVAVPVEGR